jgi:hypothetical protein
MGTYEKENERRLYNEDIHNYALHKILSGLSRVRLVGHAACIRGIRNAIRILVRKPAGKTPLGRPRSSWKDSVTDFTEMV